MNPSRKSQRENSYDSLNEAYISHDDYDYTFNTNSSNRNNKVISGGLSKTEKLNKLKSLRKKDYEDQFSNTIIPNKSRPMIKDKLYLENSTEEFPQKETTQNKTCYDYNFNENDLTVKDKMRCLRRDCINSLVKLNETKKLYSKLEESYFELNQSRNNQYTELDEILKQKQEEYDNLAKYKQIYTEHKIRQLSLEKLIEMESKILYTIETIAKRKNILVEEARTLQLSKKPNARLCVICYTGLAEILIFPCNHLCVCDNCNTRLKCCPICRGKISAKEKVKFYDKVVEFE